MYYKSLNCEKIDNNNKNNKLTNISLKLISNFVGLHLFMTHNPNL